MSVFRWREKPKWSAGLAAKSRGLTPDWLRSRYTHIAAFHAGRPVDPESYAKRGLVPLNYEESCREAVRLFSSVPADRVVAACREIGPDLRSGRVFLSIDARNLSKYCGHYLLSGSEFLGGVAAELEGAGFIAPREVLRARGIPTIVECHIPVEWLSDEEAGWVVDDMVRDANRGSSIAGELDHTITLRRAVPSDLVRRHWHPRAIHDPHGGFRRILTPKPLGCSWCGSTRGTVK